MSSMKPEHSRRIPTAQAVDPGEPETGYWRSLAELAGYQADTGDGREEHPDPAHLWQPPAVGRRDLLKLLGASVALAAMPGCRPQPQEHLVPYVNMPEHAVPGRARYYATSICLAGYAHGLLAQSHDGRPTKLEGNPQHPATLGSCDAITQAAVLGLYDPDRSAAVRQAGTIRSYNEFLQSLSHQQSRWDANQGAGLGFLTGPESSPSQRAYKETLERRWPKARWYIHDPVDRHNIFRGLTLLAGQPLEPVYRFDRARVVVSLDADFMQSQPGFLRYARDYMGQRQHPEPGAELPRLYSIESTPSITGAAADHWLGLQYPRVEDAARQLAHVLGLPVQPPQEPAVPEAWIQTLADDLRAAGGRALVVPGDQQTASVHAIAQAINLHLGSQGHTVSYLEPIQEAQAPGIDELARRIGGGAVESLVILDSNPAYTAPADLGFPDALEQVPWSMHWGEYFDETGRAAQWHIPATHPLESWSDARAFDGTAGLVQPLIQPLRGGKTALQVLAALDQPVDRDAHQLLRAFWAQRHQGADFAASWRQSLHDGVLDGERPEPVRVQPTDAWWQNLPDRTPGSDGELSLQFRPDPSLWDGRYANNGWLQELPKPLTTLTWQNAAIVSPALAESKGIAEGDVVRLETATGQLELPAYILPRQPQDAVTVFLGQGRRHAGRIGDGVGGNAYRLRPSGALWHCPVSLTTTGVNQPLAAIQQHHSIEGRDLIRAASVAQYQSDPEFAQHHGHEPVSLYPEPSPRGLSRQADNAWGMAIDLSACIGCNGCVTACQAENNIPVVGPEEVARGHDLHWIRVDRYFSGGVEAPGITFQPVPCMHCENAPCEYVCPVGATQHSSDGLNQMIYQRCIGTRYCSQNCPYKVRRFNWFDYTSAASDYPVEPAVQNPDVTVRSRGVMEKCTYCVQRISQVRRTADREGREIVDGELKTACQQACPTEAIRFGDLNDSDSDVSRAKQSPLNYAMLAHLNTRPRTTYLAAVHNPNPRLTGQEDS